MNTCFNDLATMAASRYRDAYVQGEGEAFSLVEDGRRITIIHLAGAPAAVLIHARVLDMAEIPRATDFAKACLTGNFFWEATRGATLSVGDDDVLYLTERRLLDELGDTEGLDSCLADFTRTITDWQERSALYA